MGQIRFNSTENNQSGSGWTPLPEGEYVIMFDSVEQQRSSNGNTQLKFTGHVCEGPYTGAKIYYWHTMTEKNGFILEILLRATLDEGEYEKEDTGTVKERKVNGEMIQEPIFTYTFDPETMLGREILVDCTQQPNTKDPSKINNSFDNPRRLEVEEAPAAPAPKVAAKPAIAAAKPAVTQAKPAVTQAAPAQRRRQVAQ